MEARTVHVASTRTESIGAVGGERFFFEWAQFSRRNATAVGSAAIRTFCEKEEFHR